MLGTTKLHDAARSRMTCPDPVPRSSITLWHKQHVRWYDLDLFHQSLISLYTPIMMHYDNEVAIFIANNPIFQERTKHIEVDCYYVWDNTRHHFSTLHSVFQTTSRCLHKGIWCWDFWDSMYQTGHDWYICSSLRGSVRIVFLHMC